MDVIKNYHRNESENSSIENKTDRNSEINVKIIED